MIETHISKKILRRSDAFNALKFMHRFIFCLRRMSFFLPSGGVGFQWRFKQSNDNSSCIAKFSHCMSGCSDEFSHLPYERVAFVAAKRPRFSLVIASPHLLFIPTLRIDRTLLFHHHHLCSILFLSRSLFSISSPLRSLFCIISCLAPTHKFGVHISGPTLSLPRILQVVHLGLIFDALNLGFFVFCFWRVLYTWDLIVQILNYDGE